MSIALMGPGGGSGKVEMNSQSNVSLHLNGKNAKSASNTFTVARKGVCVVLVIIGNTVGSSASVSVSCNGVGQSYNSDGASTTIDNYHDNNATAYSSCFAVNKGDTVKVTLGVGSNINDCTWRVRYYN